MNTLFFQSKLILNNLVSDINQVGKRQTRGGISSSRHLEGGWRKIEGIR